MTATTRPTPSAPTDRHGRAAPPRRPRSRSSVDLDGTGVTEVGHRPAVLRPHARQLGRHGGFDLTVAARGRPRRRRPPHRGGRRDRPGRGAWPRPWGTRPASGGSARSPSRSTRRWSTWPSTCRAAPSWPTTSSSPPTPLRSGRRRSTRSWPRSSGGPSPPRPVITLHVRLVTGKNTHHILEASFKGVARALRDAVRRRGRGHPVHQGHACDGGRAARTAVIAVLDYGIGNLRSAEKALQHLGADARLVDDPDRAAEADGVVLPGVGAFGRCAEALRASGLDRAARRRRRARMCPSSGSASGSSCSTRDPRRTRRSPGSASWPGRSGACPPGSSTPRCSGTRSSRSDPVRSAGRVPDPAWVYFVHSYAPERDRGHHVHLRLRRAGDGLGRAGPGVGHPVPPREVRRRRARDPGQLRGGRPRRHGR